MALMFEKVIYFQQDHSYYLIFADRHHLSFQKFINPDCHILADVHIKEIDIGPMPVFSTNSSPASKIRLIYPQHAIMVLCINKMRGILKSQRHAAMV